MKTFLAWRNLVHNRVRTLVAVAGVTFAVVLIFMQLGFFGAVETTATVVYSALDFDLCIRSKDYLHFAKTRSFPAARLKQAEGVAGVKSASPFFVAIRVWRNPQPKKGEEYGIMVMGFNPRDSVFLRDDIQAAARKLLVQEDVVLIDSLTRKEFGPKNGRRFGDEDIGVETEVMHRRVRVVGHFRLGSGFAANGAVLTTDRGYVRVSPGQSLNNVSLGLIKLEEGADAAEVAARLRAELPGGRNPDVEVLTRKEVLDIERNRWVGRTSFGLIFQLGVGVALFVGTAIVYQVLSADVTSLMPEYATLKAMGYANAYLMKVILQQAVVLSLLGFLPGWGLAQLLYYVTSEGAGIPIQMTRQNLLLVLVLSVAMCALSGIGAARKTLNADPAELF
ncbi:MAG: ABC transporter permease DevC [Planctomycetales bacterium]|nr:ABC transporter permease DevC [Planctomycetales bacterium]